jgi:hypothetical protein
MSTRVTALLMIAAAVLANAAFTGLERVFDYPDILERPPARVLALFAGNQGPVVTWFLLLALSAALLAPIALGVGRLSASVATRASVVVGCAAATVQIVGLLRWPLLVPGWAATANGGDPLAAVGAVDAFATTSTVLGTLIGETGGYLLTAAWTALVLMALGSTFAGRAFVALGGAAAILILAGVLAPLGVPLVDQANFVGYVLWSLWLVYFAVALLLRGRRRSPNDLPQAATPGGTPPAASASRS